MCTVSKPCSFVNAFLQQTVCVGETSAPSPAHPRIFLEIAGFVRLFVCLFVCLFVLGGFLILTEHVLPFELRVGR